MTKIKDRGEGGMVYPEDARGLLGLGRPQACSALSCQLQGVVFGQIPIDPSRLNRTNYEVGLRLGGECSVDPFETANSRSDGKC